MGSESHKWYGPEHYREPPSAVAAAIQWPLEAAERWQGRVINAFVKDAASARKATRSALPQEDQK